MRIYAFEGLRFAGDDAGKLAAPPFDQIGDALAERLHSTSEHHFSHLTRPVPGPESNAYDHSAALHRAWLETGVVTGDGAPALYPYEIAVADGSRRLGVLALVGVEDPAAGIIRPHEQTLGKPFADRLELLRRTQVDFEPVMFLSDDPGALEPLIEEDVRGEPLVVHTDAAGNEHRLFRVDDPARIARYREVLAPCPAAIADGHHRYKVACAYAAEVGAGEGEGAGCKMAVIFSLRSEHLVIDPIHRGLSEDQDLGQLASLLREHRPLAAASGAEVAAAVAAAEQPALAVHRADGGTELWILDPARMPADAPPGAENLAVAHLHYVLLPALGFSPESYLDGTVTYRSDPDQLFEELDAGSLKLGFFLPPMSPAAFGKAISKGDLLPAKSTRFLPKPASGLVWAPHDSRLG